MRELYPRYPEVSISKFYFQGPTGMPQSEEPDFVFTFQLASLIIQAILWAKLYSIMAKYY